MLCQTMVIKTEYVNNSKTILLNLIAIDILNLHKIYCFSQLYIIYFMIE